VKRHEAATVDEGIEVELTPEMQAFIAGLASHALGAAVERLRELRDQGYVVTEQHMRRIVGAIRPREFCTAALVAANDPTVTNEQIVAAARETGLRAVREVGPYERGPVN
jgi:hypothetical protein